MCRTRSAPGDCASSRASSDGVWPGDEPDRPLVREANIRRGDVVRFEALFTPERHARAGTSYRDEIELRYRVDAGEDPIEILLVAPGYR